MKLSRYAVFFSAALALAPVAALAADGSATFQVAKTTTVPGAVLKPGQYTVRVLDSLADRSILQVDSSDGKTSVLMLGVHAGSMPHASTAVVSWQGEASGKQAIRGFNLGSNNELELVYPKDEAVAIATANHSGVVAVDPASEGRPEFSKLKTPDLQIVNLWLLTPTRVGPDAGKPAIEAKHFQPEAGAPVQASAGAPATPVDSAPVSGNAAAVPPANTVARLHPPAAPHMTTQRSTTVGKKLPQTGSELPLLWIAGAVSMAGAAGFRLRRVTATR